MRKRKLYLSEYIQRITSNNDIIVICEKLNIKWIYTNKSQAINDLVNRPFWNCEIKHHKIENNVISIVIKYN